VQQSVKLRVCWVYFICLCLRKLSINIIFCVTLSMIYTYNRNLISGYIFGDHHCFPPKMFISILLGQFQLILFSDGCENLTVKTSARSFFWLLIRDCLSTRELLRRRHMHLDDYNCVLYTSQIEESVTHLFLACPFAIDC
jgi:hypothetical protein